MQFRRSGQRDERRRRALLEDGDANLLAGVKKSTLRDVSLESESLGAGRSYTSAALREHQPRVSDFIPTKWWMVLIVFLSGALTIVGLEMLHLRSIAWSNATETIDLSPFSLSQRGSLADWFASLTLGLAAVTSIFIYSIRRHKIDDYRGRYRIWIWAAVCLFLAAIDAAAGLHQVWQDAMVYLTGSTLQNNGAGWWIALAGLVMLPLGFGIALDLRQSRSAFSTIVLAGLGYVLTAISGLGLIFQEENLHATMSLAGISLSTHWLLLMSLVFYARHVLLDSQGLISKPEKKHAEDVKEETTKKEKSIQRRSRRKLEERQTKIDAPHATPSRPRKRSDLDSPVGVTAKKPASATKKEKKKQNTQQDTAGKSASQMELEAEQLGVDPDEYYKLSKSERRRLRKQKRREARS